MERVLIVSLLMLLPTMTAQHNNTTTLEVLFSEKFGKSVYYFSEQGLWSYNVEYHLSWGYILRILELEDLKEKINEIFAYLHNMNFDTALEFSWDLALVPVQSIYDDLNGHCSKYPEKRIQDLTVEPSDATCVKTRLMKTLTSMLKKTIDVAQMKASADCLKREHHICSTEKVNCTLTFAKRVGTLLSSFVDDYYVAVSLAGETPIDIIREYVINSTQMVSLPFSSAYSFVPFMTYFLISAPSIHEYGSKYPPPPKINKVLPTSLFHTDSFSISHDKFTWGIVRSNTGTFKLPCSNYKDIYSRNSSQFLEYLISCSSLRMVRYNMDLMRCVYSNTTLRPLSWSTVPSVYFNSQCLCVAFNGQECGVEAPSGVDSRHYCLSVLLRDFRRQVSYRPAVTYLDYALQTRLSVCKFSNLLAVSFSSICHDTAEKYIFSTIFSVQCMFNGLVNRELNCTRTLPVSTLNLTELCLAKFLTQFVLCDDDAGDEVRVPYYAAGDSPLVHFLTYVDIVVRVLTLVTYLACPQLRNLPGKLLTAYLMTSLLRLVLVRASTKDLPLAVHLDVALDLASTLWLTAFNHFLTSSIKTLRPPDNLTRDEALQVLLRYASLGWVLPAALSGTFICVDDALDSRVQFGQLLFVMCNYAALLGNLYMFYFNFKFYYDVKRDAELLRRGVRARSVYADLFNFALKTSVLSGAGIFFRLIFTQIQGLEHVMGYYHALGTLQGVLLFLLYGCNCEARFFWLSVGSSTLRRFHRRQNSSLPREFMEMAPIPAV